MTNEQPLYIDVEAMLAVKGSAGGHGLAMTLVCGIWEPERQPLVYDAAAILARLRAAGDTGTTAADMKKYENDAQRFFVVLDDGRWVPSPEFFSVTDGNEGGHVV